MSDGEGWQPDPTGPEDSGPPAAEAAGPGLTPAAAPAGGPPPAVPPPPWPGGVGGYPIRVEVETPERIARWRPLVQWILAIPLFIVLYLLRILAQLCAVIGWFVALFTGQLPEALGDFIAAYYRYAWHAYSYAWFFARGVSPVRPLAGLHGPTGRPGPFRGTARRGTIAAGRALPVDPDDSSGFRAVLRGHRRVRGCSHCLLRRSVHRALAGRSPKVRRRSHPLGPPGGRLVPPACEPLSTVLARLTGCPETGAITSWCHRASPNASSCTSGTGSQSRSGKRMKPARRYNRCAAVIDGVE